MVNRLALSPNQTVDPHRHAQTQIVVPHTGVLAVTTAGGTWVVAAPDQAILVPPHLVHEHRAHTSCAVTTIMLAFPPMTDTPADQPLVVGLSRLAQHVLDALCQSERPLRQRSALENVLRFELRDGRDAAHPLTLPRPRNPKLVALSGALVRSPDDQRSLADHARTLRVGERTLRRLIRSELGMSFPQWRNLVRLATSLAYLADGESVNRTAYRCGFTSPSSFITQFRELLHVTPGVYQRRMRRSAQAPAGPDDRTGRFLQFPAEHKIFGHAVNPPEGIDAVDAADGPMADAIP